MTEDDHEGGLPAVSADGTTLALPTTQYLGGGAGHDYAVTFVKVGETSGEESYLVSSGLAGPEENAAARTAANNRLTQGKFRSLQWVIAKGTSVTIEGISLRFRLGKVLTVDAFKSGKNVGSGSRPVGTSSRVDGVGLVDSYAYVRIATPSKDGEGASSEWLAVRLAAARLPTTKK